MKLLVSILLGIGIIVLYAISIDYIGFFSFFSIPENLHANSSYYYYVAAYEIAVVTLISVLVLLVTNKFLPGLLSLKMLFLAQLSAILFWVLLNGVKFDFSNVYNAYHSYSTLYAWVAILLTGAIINKLSRTDV